MERDLQLDQLLADLAYASTVLGAEGELDVGTDMMDPLLVEAEKKAVAVIHEYVQANYMRKVT